MSSQTSSGSQRCGLVSREVIDKHSRMEALRPHQRLHENPGRKSPIQAPPGS